MRREGRKQFAFLIAEGGFTGPKEIEDGVVYDQPEDGDQTCPSTGLPKILPAVLGPNLRETVRCCQGRLLPDT
ncbi:hypothetical protein GCM10023191_008900 [Actinoallomurus oryzae]|uniref:Uncharacterized protein n=1 Tax=Actinoallomurus oryzae TaxID=502180 RepID=A0ABP8PBL6_9ACTN